MKLILIFLLVCLQTGLVYAQKLPVLSDQHVQQSKQQPIKNFTEYQLGRILLYNGEGKESKFFYIKDKSTGHKVFEYDQKDSRARRFDPTFFMADDTENPIILCMSLEENYSWGVHVFIIDRGEVLHSGFINYGVDNFNFSSMALYAKFEQHGDWFKMFFQDDINIINYTNDELIKGADIEFKVEKDKITRLN
jgi:hypothetical protein